MSTRPIILLGMIGGMIWAIAVVSTGYLWQGGQTPVGVPVQHFAMVGCMIGLLLMAMVGRLAQRRFFDDNTIGGEAFKPGSGGDIDQRVLTNTVEQSLLAVLVWPSVGITYGGKVVLALGIGFVLARLFFWAGYHLSPPLRGFGFAATFYTTILAALWAVWGWM